MINKKILSLVLALMLVIGCMLSATSCMYAIDILTDPGAANTGDTDSDGGKTPESDGTNPPASNTGSEGQGDGGSEGDTSNSPIYYPGANDTSDIDGLTPEMRTLLSTVAIDAKFDIYSSYPYSDSTSEYTSYGSGVIYKLDRAAGNAYVITNYHVVYNSGEVNTGGFSDTINLYLYGMEHSQYAIPAKVIGGSMNYDIAVLEVKDSDVLKNSMAIAASLGDSDTVRVFDDVSVVGNPEGYGISATDGSISVESESLSMVGADGRTAISLRVMRTSAAVNEGNSGGGLYSADGRLIGIVNAKRTGDDIDNIGYAIPINLAEKVAENILRNCDGESSLSVKKCLIGIGLSAASSGLVTDGEGNLIIAEQVVVASVEQTCITDKFKVGDIINSITVDGKTVTVTRVHHITDVMLDASVGSVVVINATRDGVSFDVTITLPESCVSVVK